MAHTLVPNPVTNVVVPGVQKSVCVNAKLITTTTVQGLYDASDVRVSSSIVLPRHDRFPAGGAAMVRDAVVVEHSRDARDLSRITRHCGVEGRCVISREGRDETGSHFGDKRRSFGKIGSGLLRYNGRDGHVFSRQS